MKKAPRKKQLGLELALSYGFAPNRLGFCGPQEKKSCREINKYLQNKASEEKLRRILSRFEAAYAYLKLIAQKNKINDPFDYKVVEAFWVGNELLDKVKADDLRKMIVKEFAKPGLLSKKEAEKRAQKIPQNSKPHHSFHVYVFGTITGRVSLDDYKMKDICRIGWGKVKKMSKDKIIVEYYPIIKRKKSFVFGNLTKKEIKWQKEIVSSVKVGDEVSFHWNTICQKLNLDEVGKLKKYTQLTLKTLCE